MRCSHDIDFYEQRRWGVALLSVDAFHPRPTPQEVQWLC